MKNIILPYLWIEEPMLLSRATLSQKGNDILDANSAKINKVLHQKLVVNSAKYFVK